MVRRESSIVKGKQFFSKTRQKEKNKGEIVVEQLGVNPEQVTREASFVDDLGADSLDSVELIMDVEEATGLSIPEEEAAKLITVGSVLDYLSAKLK